MDEYLFMSFCNMAFIWNLTAEALSEGLLLEILLWLICRLRLLGLDVLERAKDSFRDWRRGGKVSTFGVETCKQISQLGMTTWTYIIIF